jgi:hypothetical protein
MTIKRRNSLSVVLNVVLDEICPVAVPATSDQPAMLPDGYYVLRSRTYGVFVFWRGFFTDPKDLAPPVETIERTLIYPLDKKESAKSMKFPDASNVPANMLFPTDALAFDMLSRFIDHEYVDPADMWMRGVAATLGIVKGKPFAPDAALRQTLERATGSPFSRPGRGGLEKAANRLDMLTSGQPHT